MIEKIPTPEIPGKVYENVKQLADDIREFRKKNREKIGAKADGSANVEVLRIFGKQLAKFKRGNQEFWEMESSDPKRFISANVHKEDDYRVSLNFYDRRQWEESGGKVKPELIHWMTLDENNIKNFHLQLAIKKLKPQIEKK